MISAASDGACFLTTRGAPDRGVVLPPDVRVQRCPARADLDSVVASHRAQARDAAVPLRVAADWPEARAVYRDLRRRIVAWRSAQPPLELFEADLRAILRQQHAWCAQPMRKRLGQSIR